MTRHQRSVLSRIPNNPKRWGWLLIISGAVALVLLVLKIPIFTSLLCVLFGSLVWIVIAGLIVQGILQVAMSRTRKVMAIHILSIWLFVFWMTGTAELLMMSSAVDLSVYISHYSGVMGSLLFHSFNSFFPPLESILFSIVVLALLFGLIFHEPVSRFFRLHRFERDNTTRIPPPLSRCPKKKKQHIDVNLDVSATPILEPDRYVPTFVLRKEYDGQLVELPMGNLLIAGMPGCGKTSLLAVIMYGLIGRYPDSVIQLYVRSGKPSEIIFPREATHLYRPMSGQVEEGSSIMDVLEVELDSRETNGPQDKPILVCVFDEIDGLNNKRFSVILKRAKQVGVIFIVAVRYPVGSTVIPEVRKFFERRIAFRTRDQRMSWFFLGADGAEKLATQAECLVRDGKRLFKVVVPELRMI